MENKLLVDWLKHAYKMENKLVAVLNKQAEDAENFPEIKEKVKQHLEESKGHAEVVKQCLEGLGAEAPEFQADVAQVGTSLAAMFDGEAEEYKVIKNAIMGFSSENMEIAVYTTIINIAEQAGEDNIVKVCTNILEQEHEMATWLEDNLADLVVQIYDEQMETEELNGIDGEMDDEPEDIQE